jgi:hypothetical protein
MNTIYLDESDKWIALPPKSDKNEGEGKLNGVILANVLASEVENCMKKLSKEPCILLGKIESKKFTGIESDAEDKAYLVRSLSCLGAKSSVILNEEKKYIWVRVGCLSNSDVTITKLPVVIYSKSDLATAYLDISIAR